MATRFANSHVRKPLDFGEFVDVVSVLGPFWLGLNVIPGKRGVPQPWPGRGS